MVGSDSLSSASVVSCLAVVSMRRPLNDAGGGAYILKWRLVKNGKK